MIFLKTLMVSLAISANSQVQIVEFTSDTCTACQQMAPIVAQFQQAGYPLQQVNADQHPELIQRYRISALPTFVLVVDQREQSRHVGTLSTRELLEMFRAGHAGQTASSTQTSPAPAQAPPGGFPGSGRENMLATSTSVAALGPPSITPARQGGETAPPVLLASTGPSGARPAGAADSDSLRRRALAASVRLRIEDPRGASIGSGTIVDMHGHEALVLTCGHIFRESQARGQITVDLADGSTAGLPGRHISHDLTRDVGLIAVELPRPIEPVPVGGPQYTVQPGEPVFSVGCNRGSAPSVMESRITGVNKYVGPANLVAAGQPVDGRSGGGLFNSQGVLIGVCNAADPQDNEGLYAALPTIQAELDRANVGSVYQTNATAGNASVPSTSATAQAISASWSQTGNEQNAAGSAQLAGIVPLDNSAAVESQLEVVCIVRSKQDPRASSQVLVLDEPSAELIDRLRTEATRHAQGRRTSWQTGR